LTLPSAQSAAGLVQNLPGTPVVGDTFTFMYYNLQGGDITLAAGTGVTIVGPPTIATSLGQPTSRVVACRVTSVTNGAETISCY
jgi:hypothetical protein